MLSIAKLIIFLLCAFLQFQRYPVDVEGIVVMLIAFILACIPLVSRSYFLNDKNMKMAMKVLSVVYLVAAVVISSMRCYLPLIVIDICGYRLIASGIAGVICLLMEIAQGYTNGVFLLCYSAVAAILQITINSNEKLSQELISLRDTSKEHELLIGEKNRRMREQQDAELYAATLRERNRIAREIHDNVGHMLTRSILQVGAIKTINTNEVLTEPLEGLHETLNTAMTNIRSSVHDLHDESIDLEAAVREILSDIEELSVHFDYDMGDLVPKSIKYSFISITKEAVNNVLKHSNATTFDIEMQEHPAFYQLVIEDNGTDIHMKENEGIGLTNIKDRVKSLNGNMKISTDDGFKIRISIIKNNLIN